MKLTVKTLQQKTFTIESQEHDTVLDLKNKIQESQGFSCQLQKLIHSGKILADESLVKDLNIQEKDFLVVMVTKPKATSTPTPAPPAQAPEVAAVNIPAQPQPLAQPTVQPTAQPTVPTPHPVSAESTNMPVGQSDTMLATGSAYEAAVSGLIEMGFERTQVVRAMRAAFNNPDRAAEYLMTVIYFHNVKGIPESVEREIPAPNTTPTNAAIPQAGQGNISAPSVTGQPFNMFDAAANQARNSNPVNTGSVQNSAAQLAMLRNSPQFQQIRQLVQAQPELLQPLLQQLAQSSPEMMQVFIFV